VKKDIQPLTIERIRAAHRQKCDEIRSRLREFENIWKNATDDKLFEEMVFCFFTGGCSAKMGLRSVESVRPFLRKGTVDDIAKALTGAHRYPNARARYVVHTRDFLTVRGKLDLRKRLQDFNDANDRRDWLVREKGIKGLGYKEASHFLRNIGFKGYGILDKHVLNSLAELKLIDDPKPPNTRSKYLTTEDSLRKLTCAAEIDFDELDLVLWSMKTGIILK
jgi:N-glycosylase/DNA lyase